MIDLNPLRLSWGGVAINADGRTVTTFSGGMTSIDFALLRRGGLDYKDAKRLDIRTLQQLEEADLYQVAPGNLWFTRGSRLLLGQPPSESERLFGYFAVPDRCRKDRFLCLNAGCLEVRSTTAPFTIQEAFACGAPPTYQDRDRERLSPSEMHPTQVGNGSPSRGPTIHCAPAAATIGSTLVVFAPIKDRDARLHRVVIPARGVPAVAVIAAPVPAAPTIPATPATVVRDTIADLHPMQRSQPLPVTPLAPESKPWSMALNGDGERVFLLDLENDRIDIFKTRDGTRIGELKVRTPTAMIARGGKLLVASRDQWKVLVFSDEPAPRELDGILLGEGQLPYRITAPQGASYEGKVVVVAGNLPDMTNRLATAQSFVVDLAARTAEALPLKVGNGFLDWSADGSVLLAHHGRTSYPNLKIGVVYRCTKQTSGLLFSDIGAGEHNDSPVLEQVTNNPLWFGMNVVASGDFGKRVGLFGLAVVPDQSAPVFYVLHADRIEARRAGGALDLIGTQRVTLPAELESMLKAQAQSGYWHAHGSVALGDLAASSRAVISEDLVAIQFYVPPLRQAYAIRIPSFVAANRSLEAPALGRRVGTVYDLGRALIGKPCAIPLPAGMVTEVLDGPAGMTITGQTLTWTPSSTDHGMRDVQLSAKSGSTTALLRCCIEVVGQGFAKAATAPDRRLDEVGFIKLDRAAVSLARDPGGKACVVNLGDACLVLTGDGLAVSERIVLAKPYHRMMWRGDRLVALSKDTLDVIARDGTVSASAPLPAVGLDLALLPDGRTCLVAIAGMADGPDDMSRAGKVMAIDETDGSARTLAKVHGSRIAIDPAGTQLFAWVSVFNEPRPWSPWVHSLANESPRPSPTLQRDVLVRYQRSADSFNAIAADLEPGRQCNRLVISPDGRELVTLANFLPANDPDFSSLRTYNPRDLRTGGPAYFMEPKRAIDLDHQPGGKLVAVTNGERLALFSRGAQKPLEGPHLLASLPITSFSGVLFTPDGSGLLVCYQEPEAGWVLRTLPVDHVAPAAGR
jgi:hypothetical protein